MATHCLLVILVVGGVLREVGVSIELVGDSDRPLTMAIFL